LFRRTNVCIAFDDTKTIYDILKLKAPNITNEHTKSGICEMAFSTCKLSYVGQTSRNLNVRCLEHFRYIRNNDSDLVYGAHILNNIHYYGPISNTTSLLQQVNNDSSVKSFEQLYIQLYSYNNKLVLEIRTAERNPIYQQIYDIQLCHSCA